MRKLVLILACVGLFAVAANANALRLYFSASDSLDDVPLEFTNQINATLDAGQPAYLWAHVESGDNWERLSLRFTGTAGSVVSGEMYNPGRWWAGGSDLDPVGDDHVDCWSLYGAFGGLGNPSDSMKVGDHYLVGEVTFDQGGEVFLEVGDSGILRLGGDPGTDLIYFGFGDDPCYGYAGCVSEFPDLYVGGPGWGACCLWEGECELAMQEECEEYWGGEWQGEGTPCYPNPCPWDGGACCFEGGSCQELEFDEAYCYYIGGISWHQGEHCDANPCLGACCLPDASCIDLTEEDECYQLGGEMWLSRVRCDANPCHPDTVFHVDDDAPPGGDGLTWSTAFNDLRDATDIILPGDEIRVAAGSYKPDRGTDDRSATFKLVSDVGVYGGYAGYGAADPDERDPQAYETILDGDIGTVGYKWDNSWHVLWAMDAQGVIFDGFTVTGGSGHNEAGGMRIENGSVTVANCLFVQNSGHFGGGIWFNTGDITVADCLFMQNCNGAYGGGMDILHASATLLNCRFFDNGNCQAAQLAKGGALCTWSSQLTAVNCLFSGNHVQDAYGGYGGAIYDAFSHVSLVNCTFSDNEAGNSGGAICLYSDETDMTLVNCIVWGNTAPTDPQISGPVTVIYSDVEGGWGGDGNIDADPLFVDPDGPDNDPNTFDDNDHRLAFGSPCIDAGDNTAVPPEVATDLDGEPRFVDDPATEDTGYGDPPIVDMGAYEFQGGAPIPGDLDGDGDVDLSDLAQLLSNYGMTEGATYEDGDLDGDGDVDLSDLAALLANYGAGT